MRISSLRVLRWSVVVLGIAGALAACYAPALLPGAPCATDAQCPSGQSCVARFCSITESAPVDAARGGAGDAPASDAPFAGASDCQTTEQCPTAATLGTVSGDTGHQTLTARGSRAAWFHVRVAENDSTVTGTPLRVLATLASPPGASFEVVLYVNVALDVVECSTTTGVTMTTGNATQASASWGEDAVANGVDDSRDLAIEIRPLSGSCASGATWELSVAGNPG
jgi:hypothetical protein